MRGCRCWVVSFLRVVERLKPKISRPYRAKSGWMVSPGLKLWTKVLTSRACDAPAGLRIVLNRPYRHVHRYNGAVIEGGLDFQGSSNMVGSGPHITESKASAFPLRDAGNP
jgi:hypothetical protein